MGKSCKELLQGLTFAEKIKNKTKLSKLEKGKGELER
jgi:hypothetical protein